jgi:hypothetical protein
MVSMSIGATAHANCEHVSVIHNGCVTYNFHVTSKQNGTVGKKWDYMASRFIFVGTTMQLAQKREDPVKSGTSGHPSVASYHALVIQRNWKKEKKGLRMNV